MSLAYQAMMYARDIHKDQVRKYTGNPYTDHLAEVAGIAMSVGWQKTEVHPDAFMATCWLHDSVEDQGVQHDDLVRGYGEQVADAVLLLSDLETGNRASRKRQSCERLAKAPGWVQTIKVADLISNTASIVKHDPEFAKVYLKEKRDLLMALTYADKRLWTIAREQCGEVV